MFHNCKECHRNIQFFCCDSLSWSDSILTVIVITHSCLKVEGKETIK